MAVGCCLSSQWHVCVKECPYAGMCLSTFVNGNTFEETRASQLTQGRLRCLCGLSQATADINRICSTGPFSSLRDCEAYERLAGTCPLGKRPEGRV